MSRWIEIAHEKIFVKLKKLLKEQDRREIWSMKTAELKG